MLMGLGLGAAIFLGGAIITGTLIPIGRTPVTPLPDAAGRDKRAYCRALGGGSAPYLIDLRGG